MSQGPGNRGWTPGRPQQVGFPCQMLLLELKTRLLQYHLRVDYEKTSKVSSLVQPCPKRHVDRVPGKTVF